MTPRVRVCLVGPSLDILGGQAVLASRLVRRLREEPRLAIDFLPVNPRLPGMLRRLQTIKYVRTVVTLVSYVVSLVRRLRTCDVVHCFSASYWSFLLAPLPAMLVARLYGKKVILNYRSGEADDHLRRWRRVVVPAMRLAHEIVVPSAYLVDVFATFGLGARPIANFVETSTLRWHARRPLRPRFLSNRNFERHYNVACVIRAFAIVQGEHRDASLIVAGDGSERAHLTELVRTLALRNVEFVGSVSPDRMAELYDAADVYLNAPDIDNMPNSVLEAFAAGLPVVTSDAGGIPRIVVDGRTALVVGRNDPKALAAAALRLLGDEAFAHGLAVAARAECETRYTWAAVREEWVRCYVALAGQPIGPQPGGATAPAGAGGGAATPAS